MCGGQQKTDWRNSPAHLLLLSKFRNGDSPDKYINAAFWEAVLNQRPANVIGQFLEEGMIEGAELREIVDYEFKASDLKPMLKGRGLKVSGRKEELIQRLVENDSEAMRGATKGVVVYRCTTEGALLATAFLNREHAKRDFAER